MFRGPGLAGNEPEFLIAKVRNFLVDHKSEMPNGGSPGGRLGFVSPSMIFPGSFFGNECQPGADRAHPEACRQGP